MNKKNAYYRVSLFDAAGREFRVKPLPTFATAADAERWAAAKRETRRGVVRAEVYIVSTVKVAA